MKRCCWSAAVWSSGNSGNRGDAKNALRVSPSRTRIRTRSPAGRWLALARKNIRRSSSPAVIPGVLLEPHRTRAQLACWQTLRVTLAKYELGPIRRIDASLHHRHYSRVPWVPDEEKGHMHGIDRKKARDPFHRSTDPPSKPLIESRRRAALLLTTQSNFIKSPPAG